jgi:hypothetical protein
MARDLTAKGQIFGHLLLRIEAALVEQLHQ